MLQRQLQDMVQVLWVFADRVVIDRLEEAVDALGPAGPGHVLGRRKAGLVSLDRGVPALGDLSELVK